MSALTHSKNQEYIYIVDLSRLQYLASEFNERGMVVLSSREIPLSRDQWQQLEMLTNNVDYQKVVGGDTGDAHSVWVGRFVNDVEKPIALSDLTSQLLDIISNAEMKKLFEILLGTGPLCVRRCQANRLYKDDFIGYHIDQDTTPDYFATAIFQLNDGYEGGEFCLHHAQYGCKQLIIPRYSMLLNRGDIPHEVKPVQAGVRQTLACFFSSNFGPTSKPRARIQLAPAILQ